MTNTLARSDADRSLALCFSLALRRWAFFRSFASCALSARIFFCASSKASISRDTPVDDDGMGWAVVKARSTEDAVAGANCELDADPAELEAGDVGVLAIAAREEFATKG